MRYGNYYDISQVSAQNKLQSRGYYAKEENEKADMEVAAAPVMESSISNYTTVAENQLNVSFDIDIPYDIMSNGKAHSVALKEIKLPASYKYYAAPSRKRSILIGRNQ